MTNSDSEAKSKTKPVQHYYEENDVDTYFADQKIKVPDDDSVCTFFNLFINLHVSLTPNCQIWHLQICFWNKKKLI